MATTMKAKETDLEIHHATIHDTEKLETTNHVAIAMIMILASLVGIWGVACFIGGIVECGNPLAMVSLWINAITGM
jgi:hypothetical protein